MNIFFKVFMFLTLISSCRAHKISNSHDSKLYKKNLFYITFSISSNSLNPITMSGLGENLSLTNLKIDNTENFVRSFYNKYDYTPTLILSNYINITQCLGYKLNKKLENDFYTMISDSFKEVKIKRWE